MAPFYGRGLSSSRLEPLREDSLLLTSKFPEIPGTTNYQKYQSGSILKNVYSQNVLQPINKTPVVEFTFSNVSSFQYFLLKTFRRMQSRVSLIWSIESE